MSSSISPNSSWAGPRRPRPAVLCAAALLLLAACQHDPLATPPADTGIVLREVVWRGSVPLAPSEAEIADGKVVVRGKPDGAAKVVIQFPGTRLLY